MSRRPRIVASIEARMGSSRLPGKVLADIRGRPALSRLVERLRAVARLDDIVLATSTAPADDALVRWAAEAGVAVWRGSEDDVLARVVEAQRHMRGDIVVEVTGDCPLLCPDVIELGIDTFLANDCDLVTNCGAGMTYPAGADVQVFPLVNLETVAREVVDPAVREHVSLFFYENPKLFRICHLVAPARWRFPEARLQLDYPEDLAFIRAIYDALEPVHGGVFGIEEIATLLRARPQLLDINRHCEEKAAR
jgi:spore coat polysaccharide biosynthesis protein SpsF